MLRFLLSFAIITLCLPVYGQQGQSGSLPDNNSMFYSHFYLDKNKVHVHFESILPNDARLIVSAYNTRSWEDNKALPGVADLAAAAVNKVIDSFKNPTAIKVINVHIPISNAPLTVNYREILTENTVAISSNGLMPVKIGFDTIRIIKTFEERSKCHPPLRQVEYVFLLKNASDFSAIAADKDMLQNISGTMDSVIKKNRGWGINSRTYTVTYNPGAANKRERLRVRDEPSGARGEAAPHSLRVPASLGIGLVRNTWMPTAEIGIEYAYRDKNGEGHYIAVREYGFIQYNKQADNNYTMYNTSFINVEYGNNYIRSGNPLRNLGLGLGFKINSTDPSLKGTVIRLLFNYGLSPYVNVKIGVNDNLTHKDQSFLDIGAAFNLYVL